MSVKIDPHEKQSNFESFMKIEIRSNHEFPLKGNKGNIVNISMLRNDSFINKNNNPHPNYEITDTPKYIRYPLKLGKLPGTWLF